MTCYLVNIMKHVLLLNGTLQMNISIRFAMYKCRVCVYKRIYFTYSATVNCFDIEHCINYFSSFHVFLLSLEMDSLCQRLFGS